MTDEKASLLAHLRARMFAPAIRRGAALEYMRLRPVLCSNCRIKIDDAPPLDIARLARDKSAPC